MHAEWTLHVVWVSAIPPLPSSFTAYPRQRARARLPVGSEDLRALLQVPLFGPLIFQLWVNFLLLILVWLFYSRQIPLAMPVCINQSLLKEGLCPLQPRENMLGEALWTISGVTSRFVCSKANSKVSHSWFCSVLHLLRRKRSLTPPASSKLLSDPENTFSPW